MIVRRIGWDQLNDLIVLGIETSCDETSASIVKNGRTILSNVISTQIDFHKKFGGVVPEIASRKHIELVIPVINEAIEKAELSLKDVDLVGVTYGPGLVGALLVGLSSAKALAYALRKPLIGVHHIEGHIAANYLENEELEPPFVCLVASGGHSHIVYVEDYCKFEILGQTRDDAAGEAFDKIARALGLGYPGGPLIDNAAKAGNSEAIRFPRVHFQDKSLDFSFSGLKTAVLNYMNIANQKGEKLNIEDISASFQQAVVDILVENSISAALSKKVKHLTIAGGVAANSLLRRQMKETAIMHGIDVSYPRPILCTDNAAMIACAAYYDFLQGKVSDLELNAIPSLRLGES